MTAAPDRGGLTRPAPEGAGEGADLGEVQDFSNLAEGQVRLGEQRAGNLAADLVGHLPKCAAFGFQVSVQGPAGHRVEAGDHVRRTSIPDELDQPCLRKQWTVCLKLWKIPRRYGFAFN
jgi:hypothetical protein